MLSQYLNVSGYEKRNWWEDRTRCPVRLRRRKRSVAVIAPAPTSASTTSPPTADTTNNPEWKETRWN